jgi:exo-beta-1,3-glucanase (GH17 family)
MEVISTTQSLFQTGPAICYSGYRENQSPRESIFPSYDQIKEDLQIVAQYWAYIRIYDVSEHADLVLEVIRNEQLPLKVMLGNDLRAELNNPNCPWSTPQTQTQLSHNTQINDRGLAKLIRLANSYEDIVFAASIGNEASVEWTDHLVPKSRLIQFAKTLKANISQPITFCENYVPWRDYLSELAEHLDFVSVHTYPVWEYKTIDEAMDYTFENLTQVQNALPGKPIMITEAGWCTRTNGRGMEPKNVSDENQTRYISALTTWAKEQQLMVCLFEAFDEPWKGSDDALEPEKHWGLFYVNRLPKPVMKEIEKR